MKRLFSLILIVTMTISCTAQAFAANEVSFDEHVKSELLNYAESIDISQYHLSEVDAHDAYIKLIGSDFELFHVTKSYSYPPSADENINSFQPEYRVPQNEYKITLQRMNDEIDTILSYIDNSMTDFEKILFVHDYMAAHYSYDIRYTSAAIMFIQKFGNCTGFANAFEVIMNKLGIENDKASTADHIWNVVLVDGKWYNLDLTKADTVPDMFGRSRHTSFLVDDATYGSTWKLTSWEKSHECTDKTYVDMFKDVTAPLIRMDKKWYYIDNSTKEIYECTTLTGEKQTIGKIDEQWEAVGLDGVWDGIFSGLAGIDGKLYYNTPTDIMQLDPETKESTSIKTVTYDDRFIYGLINVGNTIQYGLYISPNESMLSVEEICVGDKLYCNRVDLADSNGQWLAALQNTFTVTAKVGNGNDNAAAPCLVVALYNKDTGKMKDIQTYTSEEVINKGEVNNISHTFTFSDIKDARAKVFVLDDLDKIFPLFRSSMFE